MKLLVQQNEIGGKRKTAAAIKQLEQAQERISEISRIIKRLHEDNVNGQIDVYKRQGGWRNGRNAGDVSR